MPILVIAGPTAVGKTSLVVQLGKLLPIEVINADSRQVYRYMDIGSAKPTADEQEMVKHHLIDVVYPHQGFSAGDFMVRGRSLIEEIISRGKLPVIAGGAGLYIKALIDGIFEAPVIPQDFRSQVREQAKGIDSTKLHALLKKCDPVFADRINPRDRYRILRGLEVYRYFGKPISELHKQRVAIEDKYDFSFIFLVRPRQVLYERIDARAIQMIEQGLIDETRRLLDMGYTPDLKSMSGMGYREMIDYHAGEITLEQALQQMCQRTRNYAKRQLTWFKKDTRYRWIDLGNSTDFHKTAVELLKIAKT